MSTNLLENEARKRAEAAPDSRNGTASAEEADRDLDAFSSGAVTRPAAIWAVIRLCLAITFLWAFFDKLFALGFATGRDSATGVVDRFGPAAWINGGSPTKGYLSHAAEGPLAGLAHEIAGMAIIDWLFMLGMLGVGVALLLGIGMRIAAISGALLMLMIRAVAPVPENNPIMDEHIVYALLLFGLVSVHAGDRWGLGAWWRQSKLVGRFPILA